MLIILCISCIIIILSNDFYAGINNNCGRLHDFILLFKIPMRTRNNFFEIYRQFVHAPSTRFAGSAFESNFERCRTVLKVTVSGKLLETSSFRGLLMVLSRRSPGRTKITYKMLCQCWPKGPYMTRVSPENSWDAIPVSQCCGGLCCGIFQIDLNSPADVFMFSRPVRHVTFLHHRTSEHLWWMGFSISRLVEGQRIMDVTFRPFLQRRFCTWLIKLRVQKSEAVTYLHEERVNEIAWHWATYISPYPHFFFFRYCFLLCLLLSLFFSVLSLTILLFFLLFAFVLLFPSFFDQSFHFQHVFCLPVIFLILLSFTILHVFFSLSFISLVICLFLLQSFHVPSFFL